MEAYSRRNRPRGPPETRVAATDIDLRAGWNLVGSPSQSTTYTVAMLQAATGATRVEGFDANAAPYYLKVLADTLAAGRGYWVHVPADTVWTVSF